MKEHELSILFEEEKKSCITYSFRQFCHKNDKRRINYITNQ